MQLGISDSQKRLLALIQEEVPLVECPFAELGEKAGLSEEVVLETVDLLKQEEIIRQISAIFDTRSLGYQSSLVAMRTNPKQEDEAAAVINTHPGVTHNYRRNHTFNLWFTVAVPPTSRIGLEKTINLFHELTKANSTRMMPTLRLFKIGVNLDIMGDTPLDKKEAPRYSEEMRHRSDGKPTEQEIEFIRIFQGDLPIVSRPYQVLADRLSISQDRLFEIAQRMIQQGKLRRVAAVLYHRKAGFVANAMGVWAVPDDVIEKVGREMAAFRAVSHCYRRPVYPDWPYSIFTMVHGRNKAECDNILATISQTTGMSQYEALYSTKEYKKVRLCYFTPEIEEWEKQYSATLFC